MLRIPRYALLGMAQHLLRREHIQHAVFFNTRAPNTTIPVDARPRKYANASFDQEKQFTV